MKQTFSSPRFSIFSIIWSACCLLIGGVLIVYTYKNYTNWEKQCSALKSAQSELDGARQLHNNNISKQQLVQMVHDCIQLTKQQINKLEEENAKLLRQIDGVEYGWRHLAKQLKQQGKEYQQAEAELQFAINDLERAGVKQQTIDERISELESQLQKNNR